MPPEAVRVAGSPQTTVLLFGVPEFSVTTIAAVGLAFTVIVTEAVAEQDPSVTVTV